MALNPSPGVCEQISDQQVTKADQNVAHVAQATANTAAGIAVHKRGAVSGPGSFTAHAVYHPGIPEVGPPGYVGQTVSASGTPTTTTGPGGVMGTRTTRKKK
jgi:hypothetical protein